MKKTSSMILLGAMMCVAGTSWAQTPILTVDANPGHGQWVFDGSDNTLIVIQVTADEVFDFTWSADLSAYGGVLKGYRWGWDLTDPDDPNDAGWVTPGYVLTTASGAMSFAGGIHTFHVEAKDEAGAATRAGFLIDVQAGVATDAMTWGALKAGFAD